MFARKSVSASRRTRMMGMVAVPLLLASLAGCATPFNANVQRFQSQLPAPQGQSFAIVADDPALAGGLEFAQYASAVQAQMQRLGYAPAADAETADLVVRFDYSVDQGRERLRRSGFSDPFYSPWYGFSPFGYGGYGYGRPFRRGYNPYYRGAWGYGWNDPFLWGNGFNEVEAITIFKSDIELKIDRRADGQRLFEGKAEAVSRSNRLGYLVPNLVEAMFTDFPGQSGEVLRISIAPEKPTKVRRVD